MRVKDTLIGSDRALEGLGVSKRALGGYEVLEGLEGSRRVQAGSELFGRF